MMPTLKFKDDEDENETDIDIEHDLIICRYYVNSPRYEMKTK